jgi:hypothetical protein
VARVKRTKALTPGQHQSYIYLQHAAPERVTVRQARVAAFLHYLHTVIRSDNRHGRETVIPSMLSLWPQPA